MLRVDIRPHEAQTRVIMNALFYSHLNALTCMWRVVSLLFWTPGMIGWVLRAKLLRCTITSVSFVGFYLFYYSCETQRHILYAARYVSINHSIEPIAFFLYMKLFFGKCKIQLQNIIWRKRRTTIVGVFSTKKSSLLSNCIGNKYQTKTIYYKGM